MKSLNLTVLTVYSYVGTSIKMMTELLNIYINIYIYIYIKHLDGGKQGGKCPSVICKNCKIGGEWGAEQGEL